MIYAEAQCAKCHRFRGDGGISGPDLTSVSGRFGTKDILESIIEPSKVISDQYAAQQFAMADGRVITGRVRERVWRRHGGHAEHARAE